MDHPISGHDALLGQEQPDAAYEAPTLLVIGPVTEFTFGSKVQGNDNGPHTKNS